MDVVHLLHMFQGCAILIPAGDRAASGLTPAWVARLGRRAPRCVGSMSVYSHIWSKPARSPRRYLDMHSGPRQVKCCRGPECYGRGGGDADGNAAFRKVFSDVFRSAVEVHWVVLQGYPVIVMNGIHLVVVAAVLIRSS